MLLKRFFLTFGLAIVLGLSATAHDNHQSTPYYLFEENKGQFHENVLFRCRLPNGFMFLERGGITYFLENQEDKKAVMDELHAHHTMGPRPVIIQRGHSVKIRFNNADTTGEVIGLKPVNYHHNYFLGNDPNKWQSDVKLYREVIYPDLYGNIMLQFYTKQGSLKYDWRVLGGNADDIKWSIEGADNIELLNDSLIIRTSCGDIVETPPVINPPANNAVESEQAAAPWFECSFKLDSNTVSYHFQSKNNYNPEIYTIDPALIFATYSGSRGDNFGFTATYDSKSNLYAGGIANGAEGPYPVTTGAVQRTYGGGSARAPANLPCDITISKYDSAGTTLLWATYVGGASDEYPHSLVVNQDDDLYILGTTYSDDFPTTSDAYDKSHNGNADIVVVKISENGNVLMGSTYVGGSDNDGLNSNTHLRQNYADDFRGDIIPDETQDVFVASCTKSPDFPMVDAIDTIQDFQEGCLLQFDTDLTELKWSTFMGGSIQDALYSVKVDTDSLVYVGGGTSSDDLPATGGTIEEDYQGSTDGFVAVLNRLNHKLVKLSYWGTKEYDQVYFIDLNDEGNLFVAGQTTGNIAPSNGTIYGQSNRGQFIAKLDTGLTTVEWQTSFGARDNQIDISPSAFLVDNCEHLYMSGWGANVDPGLNPGSTQNLETSPNAVQKTTDGNDFYLIVLDKDAQGLLYATFFGGDTTDDHVDGGTSRFDKKGVVYQSVCSSCPNGGEPGHQDFPVTPNAAFTENFSPRCSNASFKIDLQIKSDVDAYFIPSPIIGCQPLTVNFDNRSDIAQKFYWDFGDGQIDSTTIQPTHTYSDPGVYEITLTVIDSNSCNISDKFTRKVEVLGQSEANFSFTLDPCSFVADLEIGVDALEWVWKTDDTVIRDEKKVKLQFEAGSTNPVTLVVNPGTLCEDSITQIITTADAASREILIPNVFTPNDDGLNDEYCIEGYLDGCDAFDLRIYNRWGERVFHSENVNDCWDGKVEGKDAYHPSGTYFYILTVHEGKFATDPSFESEDYTVSGTVTLILE